MTNTDSSTGISFGVVNAGGIEPEILISIMDGTRSIDVHLLQKRLEVADSAELVLPVFSTGESTNGFYNRVRDFLDSSDIDWSTFNSENEEFTGTLFSAIVDGCEVLYNTDNNTITVINSPYVDTFARCSPCYPGAGDLETRDDNGVSTYTVPGNWKVAY